MFPNSLFSSMYSDPFMGAHMSRMQQMHQQMNQMMGGMGMSMSMGIPSLEAPGHERSNSRTAVQQRDMAFPFGDMFGMQQMMDRMNNQMTNMEQYGSGSNPNGHFYSSSTVMSYSNTGNGPPKIYKASSSTRHAPGGIRETRKAVEDSEAGIKKMAVGRHIHERGHVIEREQNTRTGDQEEKQDYININEEEAPAFDSEWRRRTQQYGHSHSSGRSLEHHPQRHHHGGMARAITDGRTVGRYDHHPHQHQQQPSHTHHPGQQHRSRPYPQRPRDRDSYAQ